MKVMDVELDVMSIVRYHRPVRVYVISINI